MRHIIGRTRPRVRRWRLAALLALAAMPAAAPARPRPAEPWSLTQVYYSPGVGMGPTALVGGIPIAPNAEGRIASRSLVMALQQLRLGVTRPTVGPDGNLPAMRVWQTDTAEVPGPLIERYNRTQPQLALPPRIYGLRYTGLFDIRYGEFRYRVSAQLYERGRLTPDWLPVAGSRYVGDFFVTHLAALIALELRRHAVPAR